MEDNKNENNQVLSVSKKQLPISLIIVMWYLGLIEWSKPSSECEETDCTSSITVVKNVWTRRVLSVTSRIFLCGLLFQNAYCCGFYIKHYFGKVGTFYRFASYLLTFWPLMVSVQIVCLITTFRQCFYSTYYSNVNSQWWTVLTERTVSQRFHHFEFSVFLPPKLKTLLFFSTCALASTAFEIAHYCRFTRYVNHKPQMYSYLQVTSSICNIWFFSLFCYFTQLQRIALQVHFDDLIWFVKNHTGDLDSCQAKLSGCFYDYLRIRRLLHPWITSVICATAFGLAVHIAWNYKVIDDGFYLTTVSPMAVTVSFTNLTDGNKFDFNVLNPLIFVEKIVALLLALLALGGSDVSYIWKRCHLSLNIMYTSGSDGFWYKFSKNINHLNLCSTAEDTIIDLLLPLLLIAIAVLGLQDFGY
ncbi:hypothetical protein HOLleu_40881 [Holothuria leucospilota]|uniref:Uncharacterized protein n=1 Tax=Holothuria leucospilota TaxID=206669 RepID=A0A9Q1BDX8_HOLLE|nr:hypothetical protein HOLleu_40881 [Holothuria leucospilota]